MQHHDFSEKKSEPKIDIDYIEMTKKFGKNDALLALFASLGIFVLMAIVGIYPVILSQEEVIQHSWGGWSQYRAGIIIGISLVITPLVITQIKKQELFPKFNKKKVFKSLRLALVFSAALSLPFIGSIVENGFSVAETPRISILTAILLFILAFGERVFYTAFVGPRFYGAFTKKGLSIFVTGLMFAMGHFLTTGANLVNSGLSLLSATVVTGVVFSTLYYLLAHALFHWMYAKYNNIWGPAFLHFYLNFFLMGVFTPR